ncbi:MAG: class I SAM-dependent methyltransferase [Hyphomicrobiaceae bacterium]
MSLDHIQLTPALIDYLAAHNRPEPDIFRRLRETMTGDPDAGMQVAPQQGQFMALLARIAGVRRYLEIGTFIGYGTLWMASALPDDGRIVTCELEPRFPEIGRPFWREAGVEEKIEVRLGPAVETLDAMIADGASGSFDMAFVDANKKPYPRYYEQALALVRQGGLVLVDNVLWSGAVIDAEDRDVSTLAIREVNRIIRDDERVEMVMTPVGDGLTIARRRS